MEAFLAKVRRLRGEDVPEHALSTAAANSADMIGRESFVAGSPTPVGDEPLEYLSELPYNSSRTALAGPRERG